MFSWGKIVNSFRSLRNFKRMASGSSSATFETLQFDNLALKTLPIDPEKENFTREVKGACFSLVKPDPVENPVLVAHSASAMKLLDLGEDQMKRADVPEYFSGNKLLPGSKTAAHCYCGHQFGYFSGQLGDGAAMLKWQHIVACAMKLLDLGEDQMKRADVPEYFSGNKLLPGSKTAAHCYCGHQFGYFSGQLGDGAAMYLGEVINKSGERWEIQLKGAGQTPYSRHSDGRKVLRSTIREFLCSEAIHNLGIPTTRAGTCVTSDSRVVRDIFYSGNPIRERCTVVLRIAPTFFRFGSFEIFKPMSADTGRKGPSVGNEELLRKMLDYTVKTFYKEIWDAHSGDKEKMYFEFWSEVVRRTARLAADWQCVGWCHGVLNTDNMSIMGITIDYGPFGFMDRFQPDFICNASDDGGRYTYQRQPEMCKWNCKKLAEAIQMALPLAKTEPELQRIYDNAYSEHYTCKMRKKFGLLKKALPEDKKLVESFLNTMEETGSDFTNSFRCLSCLPLPGSPDFEAKKLELRDYLLSQCSTAEELKKACKPRMDPRQLQMFVQLMQTNPGILPMLGSRFAAVAQELERMEKFEELESLTDSDKRDKDGAVWDKWLDMYTDRLKLESDGIDDLETANSVRIDVMNSTNPKFILRNYIAQNAIDAAEKGDYSEVRRVLRMLENPFSESVDLSDIQSNVQTGMADEDAVASGSTERMESEESPSSCRKHVDVPYDSKPPDWALTLRVT